MTGKVRMMAAGTVLALGATLAGCSQGPDQPASPPATGSIWVADEGGDSLTVIDAASNASVYQTPGLTPAGTITLDGMPHGLRADAGGSVIVVANTMDGALDLIDPAKDQYVGAVPVGATPAQVAVSADGQYAYTGISEPPSVVKTLGLGHQQLRQHRQHRGPGHVDGQARSRSR